MREDTVRRKKASKNFEQIISPERVPELLQGIIADGKTMVDELVGDFGRIFVECIFLMERESLSGPDQAPTDQDLQKWASQPGSIYIGKQKVKVQVPRLRSRTQGEVPLKSYTSMRKKDQFSEELLAQAIRGLSMRKYEETVTDMAEGFGISPSSTSRHCVAATGKKLREFQERDLGGLNLFAIFIDAIHRGDKAFIVALAITTDGQKYLLGFWEGASENHEVCQTLLKDLERRNAKLHSDIVWITDGGSGTIKALKDRFGKKLLLQRCVIHKERNIASHLPKKHRHEAKEKFRAALQQNGYKDARSMLKEFEKWLRQINESAANSLMEGFEELLTLHRLKVPVELRKTLRTTNPIESTFSSVRNMEYGIKRHRGSAMLQRWLAATLIASEENFRKVKNFRQIKEVIENIELERERQNQEWVSLAA